MTLASDATSCFTRPCVLVTNLYVATRLRSDSSEPPPVRLPCPLGEAHGLHIAGCQLLGARLLRLYPFVRFAIRVPLRLRVEVHLGRHVVVVPAVGVVLPRGDLLARGRRRVFPGGGGEVGGALDLIGSLPPTLLLLVQPVLLFQRLARLLLLRILFLFLVLLRGLGAVDARGAVAVFLRGRCVSSARLAAVPPCSRRPCCKMWCPSP